MAGKACKVRRKVLLLKPVKGRGGEGEVIAVKAGFARNFLVPKGWAIPESRANKKLIAALCKLREAREAEELEAAQELAAKIQAISLTIAVKTGESGKLFGAVSSTDLLKRYDEAGIEVKKDWLRLPQPIKTLGHHHFQMRLHEKVVLDLSVEVVSENPIA
ncbi:MAG: 50S ribosomal protein L9 [Opitutales bacterium]|nr:50S ribosomal protein L9 [Opitutales bacterium]